MTSDNGTNTENPVSTEEEKDDPGTQNTYLCDQTVGEMGDQDFANFRHIMQKKTYIRKFSTSSNPQAALGKAMMYSGHCLDAILKKHGFKMGPPPPKFRNKAEQIGFELLAEARLKACKLQVETRKIHPDHPHVDVYQTGIYVLKLRDAGDDDLIDHEIVGFVSEPFVFRDPDKRIQELHPPICIRSTVKL